jgi:hypothetical protein
MHQPPGNLRLLIDSNSWEAEQIIRCYERPVRYAGLYRDVARLHIGFSGVLLEQLLDQRIVDRYRHILDIPEMLDRYSRAENIELIGMGYYHPIFPLIPRADWPEQLERGRELLERAFGRAPRGFWPPEMAFSMEMIPALVEAGYDYAVVDGVHVHPQDGIADVFRPYLACHEGVCIVVVPRDRDVSNAQQSGLDPTWFQNEVRWRVGGSARPHEPRLVTTWSDGENGGWFRQVHEGSGFFGYYFAPYMEHCRGGEYPVTPVSIGDYLLDHPPMAQAQVQTGAWSVGRNSGMDLSQWAGSEAQRAAVGEIHRLSKRYWELLGRVPPDRVPDQLERARRLILEAETSCYLFWGDAWIPHLYERTRPAAQELDAAESALGRAQPASSVLAPPQSPPAVARAEPALVPLGSRAAAFQSSPSLEAPSGSGDTPAWALTASPDPGAPSPGPAAPEPPDSAPSAAEKSPRATAADVSKGPNATDDSVVVAPAGQEPAARNNGANVALAGGQPRSMRAGVAGVPAPETTVGSPRARLGQVGESKPENGGRRGNRPGLGSGRGPVR